jgi:hypothetical protein
VQRERDRAGEFDDATGAAAVEVRDLGLFEDRQRRAGVAAGGPHEGDHTFVDGLACTRCRLVGIEVVVADDDLDRMAGCAALGVEHLNVGLDAGARLVEVEGLALVRAEGHDLERFARLGRRGGVRFGGGRFGRVGFAAGRLRARRLGGRRLAGGRCVGGRGRVVGVVVAATGSGDECECGDGAE